MPSTLFLEFPAARDVEIGKKAAEDRGRPNEWATVKLLQAVLGVRNRLSAPPNVSHPPSPSADDEHQPLQFAASLKNPLGSRFFTSDSKDPLALCNCPLAASISYPEPFHPPTTLLC
jgi:hypothetical protein